MGKKARVSRFIKKLGEMAQEMPDKRAGRHNQRYEMKDAGTGRFRYLFHAKRLFSGSSAQLGQKTRAE